MKAWRMLLLALLTPLLGGCLVAFDAPLPANQAAPQALLGKWTSKDAWGEHLSLEISRAGTDRYLAVSYPKGQKKVRDQVAFTVSRHGSRWYASARMPAEYGGHYAIAGFELADDGALRVYNLDVERIAQAVQQRALSGTPFDTKAGDGVLVSSQLDQVFAYLDDPANSDVFTEIARYQRAK
ncbi:MAG: hypothetical protein PW845_11695 [Pseudomonas sp.]|uniref:hypothetical protein n=1 Tax=Pseudomonas abieticivorans TaxID=2931382 RepID=UPI0020C0B8FB|nr:hypothetical protein [Pseudomonas sp. PIA16]MDE1166029.1 hypothetical protein [Pseudomonas sp.]